MFKERENKGECEKKMLIHPSSRHGVTLALEVLILVILVPDADIK